jgi:hypothetical protein
LALTLTLTSKIGLLSSSISDELDESFTDDDDEDDEADEADDADDSSLLLLRLRWIDIDELTFR